MMQKTFDSFVTAPADDFAKRACLAIASRSGPHIPLLLLHGPTSSGKTHLLDATVQHARARGIVVAEMQGAYFAARASGMVPKSEAMKIEQKARCAGLLVVDGLHALAHSFLACGLLLALIDNYAARGFPVLLSAPAHPAQMKLRDTHLTARLSGAVEIALALPDLDTRLRLLAAARRSPLVDDGALDVLALEGPEAPAAALALLAKCETYADLTQKPVGADAARDMIGKEAARRNPVALEAIIALVAANNRIDVRDMTSKARARRIARPRQMVMALAREFIPGLSLPQIGERLGGRDHTTVLHGVRRIAALEMDDVEIGGCGPEMDYYRAALRRQCGNPRATPPAARTASLGSAPDAGSGALSPPTPATASGAPVTVEAAA